MVLDKNQTYIIDNFVKKDEQYNIMQSFFNTTRKMQFNITTYSSSLTINSSKYTKTLDEKQFIIQLGQQKTMFLEILENKFNFTIDRVIRSKINWIFREPLESSQGYYPPHVDSNKDHWVLLYYVCDSDGDTLMFEETQNEIPFNKVYDQTLNIKNNIEHKMGRGVLFHGSRYHCGLPPIKNDFRITFNHNFTIKK